MFVGCFIVGLVISLEARDGSFSFCDVIDGCVSKDECVFKRPAKEGQLIKIYGEVEHVGNTSLTLYLEARAHNVYSGQQSVILSTNIKFVRIDENNDPIPISERVKIKYNKGE